MINYNDTSDVTATNHIISIINHNNDNHHHYTTLKYQQILKTERIVTKDFSLHLSISLFHIIVLHTNLYFTLCKLECY